MNKRNIVSFVTLLGVATISVAGIFHERDEYDRENYTRVTGRPRMHLLHGGESKSERRARKHGGEYTKTEQTTRDGRTVRKTTTTRRASGPKSRYSEETKVRE